MLGRTSVRRVEGRVFTGMSEWLKRVPNMTRHSWLQMRMAYLNSA